MDTPVTAESQRQLDRSLVHGMAWTGAMKWGTQMISWVATIIIAKLLDPADFGLLAMANVYLGLVQLVNEFGLGSAIIRQRNLTEDQISALGGVSLAMGVVVWMVTAALAAAVASFWGNPAVRDVIIVLGFTFVTTGLKVLPKSLLIRDLRFKAAASIEAVESIVGVFATLAFALLGYRYWSLVWGSVAAGTVSSLVAMYMRPHRRHWPRDFSLLRAPIKFGWHVVVSRFAWYVYMNADLAVVGRLFDKVVLGGYSYAMELATIPVSKISSLIGQVTPAVFSSVQESKAELRRYLLRLTEVLALMTFPFSVGMALVASDFVHGVLGEQWIPAIVPLQLLSLYAGFRSITTLHSQVLNSVGKSGDQMRYSLVALVVLPILFFAGAKMGGVAGVAWAWIIGFPLVMIAPYRAVFAATDTSVGQYMHALWPASMASAGIVLVVLAIKAITPPDLGHLNSLVIQSAAGAITYFALLFAFQRKRLLELRVAVQHFRT